MKSCIFSARMNSHYFESLGIIQISLLRSEKGHWSESDFRLFKVRYFIFTKTHASYVVSSNLGQSLIKGIRGFQLIGNICSPSRMGPDPNELNYILKDK